MSPSLLLLPAIPALSAAFLALRGGRLPYNVLAGMATTAAGLAFLVALSFVPAGILGTSAAATLDLGPWIATPAFEAALGFRLDSLSLMMTLLVTFFGFAVTAYSAGYMRHDSGQGRFFASLNLFVAAMLVLVLSDNLLLLFLGWEGVGVCSYLLIGHYWTERTAALDAPRAAYRAFFVNRVGDVLLLLGVFTVLAASGTLSLPELAAREAPFAGREGLAVLAAFLVLGGAFAKSAQAPLHVWLADAMAGPTPVSALIHAATMVTAGVYLVSRLDWLFAAVPEARLVMAACALATLVAGVFLALTRFDIKKILAYSTLSNLALMFLALASGATQAALLHLFGHAFFKALLFLSAGSVIHAAHHEQDARRLGGVLKTLPVTRVAFWVGCIGGAGFLPFVSAGFFTKEAVLESIRAATFDGFGLGVSGGTVYAIVLAVESLAAVYLFRLLGYLSGGPSASGAGEHEARDAHHDVPRETSPAIRIVLAVLAVAAPAFAVFSGTSLPAAFVTGGAGEAPHVHWGHVAPILVLNLALAVATFFVFASPARRVAVTASLSRLAWGGRLAGRGPLSRAFWFDDVYAMLVLRPLYVLAWFLRLVTENIAIGVLYLAGWLARSLSLLARRMQTGSVQHYAGAILLFLALAAWMLLWRHA